MNQRGALGGWRRRSAARAGAVILSAAALAVLAAACGSSSGTQVAQLGSTTTQTSTSAANNSGTSTTPGSAAIVWTRCMRAHGVPNLPDQTGGNPGIKIPSAQQLGVSSSQLQAAVSACRRFLPNGGQAPSEAAQQQQLHAMLLFAKCMRRHGVPDWPDPIIGPQGKAGFNLVGLQGVDTPQAQNATRTCGHLVAHSLGGIAVER